MKTSRLTALLISLLSIFPLSAGYTVNNPGLYYDPDGVENPLDSDITENVRYVTYECNDAKFAEINWKDELKWRSSHVYLTAIYCEDGTVYLNRFLSLITPTRSTKAFREYWIKGKLSEDGQYINIPVGQMAATNPYTQAKYFHPAILTVSENQNSIKVDDSTDVIKLRIENDGSVSPLGIDDTHGWGCMSYLDNEIDKILFCGKLVPTEKQPILPPPGFKKEDYEFKFIPTVSSRIHLGDIGKRVKVVFLNDTIFIQGLSYERTEGWSVGIKNGDSYIFGKGNQPLENVALNAIKYETALQNPLGSHYNYDLVISPIDDDVIFYFNQESHSLKAQSSFCLFDCSDCINFDYDLINLYGDIDIYTSAILNKIPNAIQYPQPPEVKINDGYGRNKMIIVSGSYFDTNGYVMDVKKLFYKLYIDGMPYAFTKIEGRTTFELEESTELLSYDILNFSVDTNDIPSNYTLLLTLPSTFKEVKAELVYLQDGQEISSGVNSIYDDSDLNDGSGDVFDLTGRKVNPQSLSPGIYIRRGQKFIVRQT